MVDLDRQPNGSRPAYCEVDYALGGGRSGVWTCEGGVSTASRAMDGGTISGDPSDSAGDASAIGAHGVMDEHPSGAHGSLQGA